MANARTNTTLNSKRPLAIVAMLLAALFLVVALGWQAWRLHESHQATADSVLREYAVLAADEFGRRAVVQLGYQGYYRLISRFVGQKTASAMAYEVKGDDSLSEIADLAKSWFVYLHEDYEYQGPPLTLAVSELLRSIEQDPVDPGAPYLSARTADGTEQIIINRRLNREGSTEIAGFVVQNSGIGWQLEKIFLAEPLLPASLADGKVNNDMLFLRVTDPAGVVLIERNPAFNSRLTVSKTMGEDYQGILKDYRIEISLDPGAASALVIGGLPRSRVPLLLIAVVFVFILMLSAIWLFRREQAVMKLRSDFVSQVSHELRTPLTQIRMFAETLLMDRARNDDEKRRSLEIINRESRRLSHLVDNILTFSNGAQGHTPVLRDEHPAPIVSEVCHVVQSTAGKVKIETDLDQGLQARIDSNALRQIVLNLLDNAIKYGPDGQTIRVSLARQEPMIVLCVEDEGPGIPESEYRHIWKPFYRMRREEKTAISGTGIGLSVVRQLAESMGGDCRIQEGPTGARVLVTMEESGSHG